MEMLDRLAELVGLTAADVRPVIVYYAWLVAPVLIALVLVAVVLVKVMPRQRRRDDLSGRERP